MMVPAPDRVAVCDGFLRRAARADRYRQFTGKAHPLWGTGSLMEVARWHPMPPEPGFDNPAYCAAMRVVLGCLQRRAFSRTRS
ncbi:hypothetical protein [Aestuariivita boseongensis]|uniref:DUF7742 family protein n=1 Tax=Aestuariivita boseongensis TaxID=1470562 RepID=UPI0012FC3137|nr:hypothetical protein [Aestuariivita boseongensis]